MLAGPILCPVLIGRTRELQELVDRRLAAARGKGSCVLLAGEAGMGKTRLLSTFRETLTGGRAAIGIGTAREFGNAPYGPLRESLAAAGIAWTFSEGLTREERFAALADGLAAACRRRTLVLLIEDAQWADEGSLQFLLYLLPAVASMRLFLIVTHRTEDLHEYRPFAALLPRFARAATTFRISLGPLRASELRRLARLSLGERARLAPRTIAEIVERCEGNPFFAEELLKNALERRLSANAAEELPLTIRAAVLERCAALDATSLEILTRAAIFGPRFDAALLAAACGRPLAEVLAALRKLRDFQIIEELAGTPATYAFRHTLTREAVYGRMLRDEVTPLHRNIVEALERGGGNSVDLGYHAWAAGDGQKSLRYNEIAGDEATTVHAYADALSCYQRALTGATEPDARGRLLEKAADAAAHDGKADLAASLYQRAAVDLEENADPKRVALLYLAMSSQARLLGDTLEARAILQRAIAHVPDEAATEKAKLQLALAFTHLDRCEIEEATELIARAQAIKSSATYASAVNYCAAVRGDLQAIRQASALYLVRCATESREAMLRAKFNQGFTLCVLGIDREALRSLEPLLPQVAQRRLRSLEVLACANVALIYARAGRWDAARDLIERGLAIPEPSTTGPIALASAGLTLAQALSDDEMALQCAPLEIIEHAFSSRINSTLGRVAGPYARWRHARGDVEEANRVLRQAMALLGGPFGATETLLAAAELGDDWTAEAAFSLLPALDAMPEVPLYAATGAHLRALAARRRGDRSASERAAALATLHYRELGWPLHELWAAELSGPAVRVTTSVLSTREREIAALVAQGIPNKGLAQRLAVSQRTVEKHLTSIFGKLGLRNRTELTALIVRKSQ